MLIEWLLVGAGIVAALALGAWVLLARRSRRELPAEGEEWFTPDAP